MKEGPKGRRGEVGLVMQAAGGAGWGGLTSLARWCTHRPARPLHIGPGVAQAGRQMCVLAAACSRHEPMAPKPAA